MGKKVKILLKRIIFLGFGPILPAEHSYAAFVDNEFIGSLKINILNKSISEESLRYLKKIGIEDYEIEFSEETISDLFYLTNKPKKQ